MMAKFRRKAASIADAVNVLILTGGLEHSFKLLVVSFEVAELGTLIYRNE